MTVKIKNDVSLIEEWGDLFQLENSLENEWANHVICFLSEAIDHARCFIKPNSAQLKIHS